MITLHRPALVAAVLLLSCVARPPGSTVDARLPAPECWEFEKFAPDAVPLVGAPGRVRLNSGGTTSIPSRPGQSRRSLRASARIDWHNQAGARVIASSATGFWGRTIWIFNPEKDSTFAVLAGYSDFAIPEYRLDLHARRTSCAEANWVTPAAGEAHALPMPLAPDSLRPFPSYFVQWAYSGSAGSLRVAGTVTDLETSDPLENARVSLPNWGDFDRTDVDGRYGLRVPGPGEYIVNIELEGYTTASARVTTQGGGVGLDVRLGRWRPTCAPPCQGPGCHGVRVSVVDARTRVAPTAEVQLSVSYRGTRVAAARSRASGQARLFLTAAEDISWPGPLDATVSAPGYDTVRLEGLWLNRLVCSPNATEIQYLALEPRVD